MELVPLADGFGVEVKGVSLLDVATDAQAYKEVRAAFETHSLLVFRDQQIADARQAFGQQGEPVVTITFNSDCGQRFARATQNGIDVNRDHLTLETPEAQAIARVVLDWSPSASVMV